MLLKSAQVMSVQSIVLEKVLIPDRATQRSCENLNYVSGQNEMPNSHMCSAAGALSIVFETLNIPLLLHLLSWHVACQCIATPFPRYDI